MPRPPRLLLSHSYYHIMTRGNNRHAVFENNDDYLYYLNLVRRFKKELPFDLYHYVLMPNHIHFLIQTKNANNFAVFMKKLNLAYFHYYHQHYGWVGHFWQNRYKSQVVGKDSYFIQAGKYIELNPVRKGLVSSPADYRYSSYRHYAFGQKDDLITDDIFFDELGKTKGERQKNYREMIIGEELIESYSKPIWGNLRQRKNEQKKINYHYHTRPELK